MRIFGLIGVVIVLCVGFFLYQRSVADIPEGSPEQQIDTVAIRQRLLTIAQTERQYQASNGKYATLEQLASDNLLPGGTEQRGYTFTASVTSTGFTIPVREVRLSAGAEFIVAICGEIMTMPGLPKVPSANSIDVNEQGKIVGLF